MIKFTCTLLAVVLSLPFMLGQTVSMPDSTRTRLINTPTSDTIYTGLDFFYGNMILNRINSLSFSAGVKKIEGYIINEVEGTKSYQRQYDASNLLRYYSVSYDTLVMGQLGRVVKSYAKNGQMFDQQVFSINFIRKDANNFVLADSIVAYDPVTSELEYTSVTITRYDERNNPIQLVIKFDFSGITFEDSTTDYKIVYNADGSKAKEVVTVTASLMIRSIDSTAYQYDNGTITASQYVLLTNPAAHSTILQVQTSDIRGRIKSVSYKLNSSTGELFVSNITDWYYPKTSSANDNATAFAPVFPNPTGSHLTVSTDTETLEILDSNGRFLKRLSVSAGIVDISDLHIGLYFVRQISKGRVGSVEKVIKL
jgi:hypothetical protein